MSAMSADRHLQEEHRRDRWLVSYADLVTLLLALFIVLYAASDRERAKYISEAFSSQAPGGSGVLPGTAATDESSRLEKRLSEDAAVLRNSRVRRTSDGVVISMNEAGLFAPGDAALSPQAIEQIAALAAAVADVHADIRVEGHTDPTPISGGRFHSNWELSTARAASVLTALVNSGVEASRLSAAGYAEFRPIADNATSEGRAFNRRVDLVVLSR